MGCVLVLDTPDTSPVVQGNLLLDHHLGADVRLVHDRSERMPMMKQIADELRARGDEPYVIPTGGSNPIGASAYVAAVFEIMQQLEERAIDVSRLYVTTSTSGGTHAGLAIGNAMAGAPFEIVGIAIEGDAAEIDGVVRPLANATAGYLGADVHLPEGALRIDDRFVGPGYGVPTDACLEAIGIAARTEGLLLDPVYTAKTMAGMIDHIRSGLIDRDETVLFLHTGGTPALFAQAVRVLQGVRRASGRLA
jgi:D-cysteine desulfhydrase